MAYSLGLTLYTLGARSAPGPMADRPQRPPGPLAWLHGSSADAQRALIPLTDRLIQHHGVCVLITGWQAGAPPRMPGLRADVIPADAPADVRAFLDYWRPGAILLTEGELRPLLIAEARQRGIPVIMADARDPWLPRERPGWWPGLVRAALAKLTAVFALDEPGARNFRRAGAAPEAVHAAGRMEQPSAALSCTEAERAALSRLLASRPVWLAAGLPEAEERLVIEAHRSALRLTHRLLLIVAPAEPDRAEPLAEQMERLEGWTVARRAAEEEPDPEVQVLVADGLSELGLWLRLAPVTYLGGSLTPSGCRIDPMAAAALGTVAIHGPRVGDYGGAIGRLAAAQASALVGSASDLAAALAEMQSPERAARFAQAAWAVASEGSEVTDQLAELLAGHARKAA